MRPMQASHFTSRFRMIYYIILILVSNYICFQLKMRSTLSRGRSTALIFSLCLISVQFACVLCVWPMPNVAYVHHLKMKMKNSSFYMYQLGTPLNIFLSDVYTFRFMYHHHVCLMVFTLNIFLGLVSSYTILKQWD